MVYELLREVIAYHSASFSRIHTEARARVIC